MTLPLPTTPTFTPDTPKRTRAAKSLPGKCRVIRIIAGLGIALSGAFQAAAIPPDPTRIIDEFESANRSYEKGEHLAAAAAYQLLIDRGVHSASLYFNNGNAHFQTGNLGQAIAAYRMAERVAPRDSDIRKNLGLARAAVGDPALQHRSPLAGGMLTINELTILTMLTLWIWIALAILKTLRPNHPWATRRSRAIATSLALGLSFWMAWVVADRRLEPHVIAIAPQVPVRYGPLEESQIHFAVTDGMELRLLNQRNEWMQIIDSKARMGWIPKAQVILVPFD